MKKYYADVVIVGSGLAALVAAEQLSLHHHVIMITKSTWQSSNSFLAQGGIAATLSPDDDWRTHLEDTIKAGHEHNDLLMTQYLVKNSKHTIQKLIEIGMTFDSDANGHIRLAREGGHRRNRILHAGGDATGRGLVDHIKRRLNGRVDIHEFTQAMDLLVEDDHCRGLWARDAADEPIVYTANHTILATGGVGQIYAPSSNDPTVTGDGLAMAYRAGAKLADMEFIQFHPTLLVKDGRVFGLVSEAVRGEGAKLINQDGSKLMEGVHPQEDLAPRDVVARTLFQAKTDGRAEKCYLDVSAVPCFEERFPTITHLCKKAKVDLAEGRIPVDPGAHFSMGGIVTDLYGRTTVQGLYVCGEAACTGVHGANRIASHSLLEAVTFAMNMSEMILSDCSTSQRSDIPDPILKKEKPMLFPQRKMIQDMMFRNVGIVRNEASLRIALHWFEEQIDFNGDFRQLFLSKAEMEILNMLTSGWLITTSAIERTESRGGHFRTDYPHEETHWHKKQILRGWQKVEQH